MKFKCVIFDLDGSLADTLEDIARSMNAALAFYGFPILHPKAYAPLVGRGLERLAEDCLPERDRNAEQVEKLARKALECYAEKPLVSSKPYPGILEMLYGLKDLKIRTAVLSNKPGIVTDLVIEGLFPRAMFDIVQGELPGAARKPDPASTWEILLSLGVTPRETLFAGDSEIDMETAKAADCSPLGLSWGYRSREALIRSGAARIIDSPLELLDIVRETRY
jgi:phosphoglycolate phosphatase